MSLNEEVFVYFMGTLHLVIYLVCGLGTSKVTCSSGDTVTSWSEWTCNIENSTATRTRNCTDNEHVSETVKVTVYSWTSWLPWSPSCGAAEVHRSRSCVVPLTDSVYCSICGYENTTRNQTKPSNLPPCCKDYPFGPWTSWHPPYTPDDVGEKYISQSRTRERNCSESSDCTLCPIELETRRVILQSWSKWGEWSGTLRPCAENIYRRRSRSCPAPTNPQDYPVYSCCNSTSDDVEYSCCGSVYTLRNISCGSEYCLWECYNKTSSISHDASSPLIKDPFVCLADPPQCSELGRTWNVSLTSTSCSEYTIITMNSESTELSSSDLITMTDTSTIVTTLASLSWNTPPSTTVYSISGSPKSTASPELFPPNSTECPSSSLPYTPPSANDTSVPVYIWVIIGVSVVGVTILMIIGAILLLTCCCVKKFRQRDDERRSPLLSVHEYEDELEEIVLFNIRDHPQVDEDTTEGEFVDVTEQGGEKIPLGIKLPYEVFSIEEKRNPRAKEYKNIKTTYEKRPSTKRRSHPKLFDSDEDDEVFAL